MSRWAQQHPEGPDFSDLFEWADLERKRAREGADVADVADVWDSLICRNRYCHHPRADHGSTGCTIQETVYGFGYPQEGGLELCRCEGFEIGSGRQE